MRRWRDWDEFEPTRPLEAKGGIRAQTQRGSFGKRWWSQRWTLALEQLIDSGRLARGRTYARKGQVLSVQVESGVVKASVQGSRARPYAVVVRLQPLGEAEWQRAVQCLAAQTLVPARLLAGEMPPEVEEVFAAAQLSLFPAKQKDLATECSCPDWASPCKHVAAVYCLLAEEFDRDPFLLFKLRGMERERLVQELGKLVAPADSEESSAKETALTGTAALSDGSGGMATGEGLEPDLELFWRGHPLADDQTGAVETPALAAVLVRQLGPFPFWRGEKSVLESLEPAYARASRRALLVLGGEAGGPQERR